MDALSWLRLRPAKPTPGELRASMIHSLGDAYAAFLVINKGKSPDADALAFLVFVANWVNG